MTIFEELNELVDISTTTKNGVFTRRISYGKTYFSYAITNVIRREYTLQSPKHSQIYAYTPLSQDVIL